MSTAITVVTPWERENRAKGFTRFFLRFHLALLKVLPSLKPEFSQYTVGMDWIRMRLLYLIYPIARHCKPGRQKSYG